MIGRSLGHYAIDSQLGAGGMGVVYKATDTKLGRTVAIKLIRDEWIRDAQHIARFEREARMLASLNHPHVGAIHGLEEYDGTRFLVLEYVPGQTLAECLKAGPLPTREAMLIAKQVAEALEAAHEKGIIHRDLKPANIKLTDGGVVKVLDFGLAKSVERPPAPTETVSTATLTAAVTQKTVIIGTAAYMSPEQACGKETNSRTDVWSFGCVLYEALTGRQAFRGATTTEILACILEREPDWEALPPSAPLSIKNLVRRCLRKDLHSRLRHIGDARIELEDALAGVTQLPTPVAGLSGITRRTIFGALAGGVVGATSIEVIEANRRRSGMSRNVTRFTITLPEGQVFPVSFNTRLALSPDGTQLVYLVGHAGQEKCYLRPLNTLEPKPITARGGGGPFFSPDSKWIAFLQPPNLIRKLAVTGGAPVTICLTETYAGGSWAPDDTIFFVRSMPGGIVRVPAAGGEPKEVSKIDLAKNERMHKFPHVLPGGKALLFTTTTADAESFDDGRIAALSLDTGRQKVLVEGGTYPRYSPSGHLLYARNGGVLAVPFDPERLEIKGQPFAVLEGVLMSRNTGVANYDVNANGDLAYVPGVAEGGERTLVWVDRKGKAQPLALPPRSYLHPRISPDARQLAIEIEGPNHDLYVYDFSRGILSKMTTDGLSHWPIWSPDGRKLTYRSGRMGAFTMWWMPADRSKPQEQIPPPGHSESPVSWSPDGHALAYTDMSPDTGSDVMVLPLDGDRKPRPFANSRFFEGSAKFSPDGRWLAYCSNESGRPEVYVQAYPGPGPKIQVSTEGGTDPLWKRAGGELFYRDGDKMMVVAASTASGFSSSRPQVLWEGHYSHGMSSSCGPPGPTSSNYDVTPDGQRFLMIKDNDQDSAAKRLVVVLGWADELARREKVGQALNAGH